METPKITILNDFDDIFKSRVEAAIEHNQKFNIPMVKSIEINAGPYRSYCFGYKVIDGVAKLDFYSPNRRLGFEHTIEDIAEAISIETKLEN